MGVNCSNNSYNDRLSLDASKTGGCKPTRILREGCGSTEPGVCSFVLGTYPQRGSAPPPPSTGFWWGEKGAEGLTISRVIIGYQVCSHKRLSYTTALLYGVLSPFCVDSLSV